MFDTINTIEKPKMNLNSIFSGVKSQSNLPPFAKAGVKLDDLTNTSTVLKQAGLDWNVNLNPVFVPDATGSMRAIPGNYAVVKDTEEANVLGLVKSRYVPIQNAESFGTWLDDVFYQEKIVIDHAGQIDGGRKVWMTCRLDDVMEILPGDFVSKYLVISTSHDGSASLQIMLTPIRVICQNTLVMAERNSVASISIRHNNSQTKEMISSFLNSLKGIREHFLHTEQVYKTLAQKQLSIGEAQTLTMELLAPDVTDSEEVSARTRNRANDILRLFSSDAKGIELAGHTAYGYFQAVTESLDYSNTTKAPDKHLASTFWGQHKSLKQRALDSCVAPRFNELALLW